MNDTRQLLQDHFEDPYHRGECEALTHAATATCAESQCQLAIELCLDRSGQVLQAWFDGAGCEFCEAVASMLVGYCEGRQAAEMQQLPPSGYLALLGVTRTASADGSGSGSGSQTPGTWPVCHLLPLQTLRQALATPVTSQDSELGDWAVDETGFGGPSLREEC